MGPLGKVKAMLNVTKTKSAESEMAMPIMTEDQLAQLGEGLIAYVKPIRFEDVGSMFAEIPGGQPGVQLFALLGANGRPLILTDSRDAAVANAMQNELHMVSLH